MAGAGNGRNSSVLSFLAPRYLTVGFAMLAKFEDAVALALHMGHAIANVSFAHYRAVVTGEAAAEYWSIEPS